jgi:hypothetical protein
MVLLAKTKDVLTRTGSPTTYATFRLLIDGSGRTLGLPVPKDVPIQLKKITLTFSWAVSSSPAVFRPLLFDSEPDPALTLTDNTDPNISYLAHVNKFNRLVDVQVFPTYGLSFGVSYFASTPRTIVSTTGIISAVFYTTSAGTTAPANGQIELGLYYEQA